MATTAPTQTRRRRGRPAENREKLLHAALRLLGTTGYANTTARDLVEESGTNLASIGYHFGSKEALLNEAITRTMDLWTASVEQEMFAGEPVGAEERVTRALNATIDRFGELETYLVSFVESFPPAMRDENLRSTMAAAYEQVRTRGRDMLRRAFEEDGASIGDHDADVLTSLVLAICDGLFLQWILEPGRTPTSREVMSALRVAATAVDE